MLSNGLLDSMYITNGIYLPITSFIATRNVDET